LNFLLATDTSCDIPRSELKARGIEYKPLVYTIDGNAYADEFSTDAEYKAFYAEIRSGKLPTTSQINIAEHEEFFSALVEKCDSDILYVTLSSGLSGSYACAVAAAESVKNRTGRSVYVVDSLSATIAARHVVDKAERLRDEGMSAADAAAELKRFVSRLHTWFMPYDLMHLKRGGRVSGPMAYLGTALNIKPILFINKTGGLSVTNKVHGVPKALALMTDKLARDGAPEPQKIYIASADSEYAEELLEKVRKTRPDCEAEIGWIGPVIGSHTGCGAVGLSFIGKGEREI